MAGPSHLVALFVATAGQNAENLGTDEEQIVLCVYMLYDIVNNKINSVQVQYVSPKHNDIASEILLTPECKIQTGIKEEVIRTAPPLEQVIEEFERFVRTKEVHPDHGGNSFVFVCDGPLHLRMCVHAEAAKRNINLPQHFYKYYDIRKAFKSFYKMPVVNCIKDMLEFIGLDEDPSTEYGAKHCQDIASILHRLISDGFQFEEPCIIKSKLEQGICNISDVVDDDTIVRARGLPWQSSDQDIARFFQGLNVEKGGVALCLSQQGRRNGEALVRFADRESRDLALRKHKHHLGQRYIEVYRASGRDFLMVAGGNSSEAQTFLSRHSEQGGQVIIRMRGLPYSATSEQVLNFFKNGECCDVLDKEKGLLFVHQADGRATGDAFVLFSNDEEAGKALAKHRQCIGSRYIELFKSTTAEVQQVLNRSLDPRPTDHVIAPYTDPLLSTNLTTIINQQNMFAYPEIAGMASMAAIGQAMNPAMANNLTAGLNPATLAPALAASALPYGNGLATPTPYPGLTQAIASATVPTVIANGMTNTSSPIPGIVLPQHVITSGTHRDCIRLKGLPYEATVTDILNFLSEHSRNIVFQGVHMVYNSQGSLSGEAFIQMDSENSAELAAILKDRKFMMVNSSNKKRYIEVVQCCGQDMNLVLTNGTQTTAISTSAAVSSLTNPMMAGIMGAAPGVMGAAPGVMGAGPGVMGAGPGVMGAGPGVMGAAPGVLANLTPNPMMFQIPRPILSPGGILFPNQALFPPSTPGTANMAGLIPSTSANLLAAGNPIANGNLQLPPAALAHPPQIRPPFSMATPGATAPVPPGYIYWYPSPPVSPQSQPYFIQPTNIVQTKTTTTTTATIPASTATSVIVKGLPYLAQASDLMTLFDGIFEMQPEIEIIRTADGRHVGEAIVTFGTRNEAERAIIERNRKMVGQRSVELHMA